MGWGEGWSRLRSSYKALVHWVQFPLGPQTMVKGVKFTIYNKQIQDLCLQVEDELTDVDVHTLVMINTADKIWFMMEQLRMMPVDPERPWATSPD